MNRFLTIMAMALLMLGAYNTDAAAQKRTSQKREARQQTSQAATEQPVNQQGGDATQPMPQQTTIARQLTNGSDSLHYVIGAYLGQYVNDQGFAITNPNMFLLGMDDALSNNTLLISADTVALLMNSYLAAASTNKNIAIEKELFDGLKGLEGVGSLPTGVYYLIAKTGVGRRPLATDTVTINVKGYLPTGEVFEDSYAKNAPLVTTPQNLISGMRDILQIMPAGSTWRVFIPAAQAYAERGVQGIIPAYSAVIFDIELLDN